MSTRIWRIESYGDVAGLRTAVGDLIDAHPAALRPAIDAGGQSLVVVKPNWIGSAHQFRPDVWEPVITHPAVICAVVECLAERLHGQGTIAICDASGTQADFEAIVARGGLKDALSVIQKGWPRLNVEIIDLRREVWICKEEVVVSRHPNPPDPRGYVRVDLGRDSLFYGHRGAGRYYGADYDQGVVNGHHHGDVHEYLLSGTAMQCHLFVNIPKFKTHKKTGITCCLKNLVGINGDKNWLPHHTEGTPHDGGDEFPTDRWANRIERRIKRIGRNVALKVPVLGPWMYRKARNLGKAVLGDSETVLRAGNWHGNDTCWRMALDLNRALLYGNSDGTLREAGQTRPYLGIIDGIVGGQGNGPVCPDPAASGVLLGGDDPAVLDAVACRLMGFDPQEIPLVREAFAPHRWPVTREAMAAIRVWDSRTRAEENCSAIAPALAGGFRPHFGWEEVLGAGRA